MMQNSMHWPEIQKKNKLSFKLLYQPSISSVYTSNFKANNLVKFSVTKSAQINKFLYGSTKTVLKF